MQRLDCVRLCLFKLFFCGHEQWYIEISTYVSMFPNSKTAEKYIQAETKTKYVLQFGTVAYFRKSILKDFKDQSFTFNFDGSTTNQVKKQYDAFVQFWSSLHQQIVNRYCGSVFVGHCGSEKLLNQFFEFGKVIVWGNRFLLHIGMDGPNVNLKFQEDLRKHFLQATGQKFLDIDTCTLHKVHNPLKREWLHCPFAVDFHGFFKLSSIHCKDYSSMEKLADITSKYLLHQSSVCWLTMKYVLVRIIEQWEN